MTDAEAVRVLGALAGEPLPWLRKGVRVAYWVVYPRGYMRLQVRGVCTARGPKLCRILWDGAPIEAVHHWDGGEHDAWFDMCLRPEGWRWRRKR